MKGEKYMNKFITKLAKIFLGLSMAAGVGVAVSAGRKDASPVHGADSDTNPYITINLAAFAAGNNGTNPTYSSGKEFTFTATSSNGSDEVTIAGKYIMASSTNMQCQANNANIYNKTAFPGRITSIVLNQTGTVSFTAYGGTEQLFSSSETGTGKTPSGTSLTAKSLGESIWSITSGTDYTYFAIHKGSSAGYVSSIVVHYESSGGGGSGGGGGGTIPASGTTTLNNTTLGVSGTSYTTSTKEIDGVTYSFKDACVNSSQLRLKASGQLYNSTAFTDRRITSVEVNAYSYSSTGGGYYLYGGTSSKATTHTFLDISDSTTGKQTASFDGYDYTYFYLLNKSSRTLNLEVKVSYETPVTEVTVTFNLQNHGSAISSQTISKGEKATQPTAPTATGWTFGGWYKEAGCTTAWNFNDAVNADLNLYAKWTATTYSISYTLNGGTHGSTHPTSGTYDTVFSVSAPTKAGHTFTGWTVTSGLNTSTAKWGTTSSPSTAISSSATLCVNGTSAVYFKNINAASTAVTFTANWSTNTYTIDDSNISNGSLSDTTSIAYNEELNVAIVPDEDYTYPSSIDSVTMGGVAYDGYEYDSSDGSFYIEHVTGNVVIVASCVDASAVPYTVNYSLSHCSISNAPESIYSNELKQLQIVADDHYKFPLESQSKVSVSGIDGSKWSYDEDDGTILISEPNANMTVTVECVAKETYDITLSLTNVAKSSGPSGEDAVEEGEEVTIVFAASANYGLPSSISVEMGEDELIEDDDYTWDQGTGTLWLLELTDDLTVTISGVARDLTNVSLSLGSKKDAYTLGDDFELPATVTANFNIAPLTVDVKNEVKVSGPVTKNNDKYVVTGNGTVVLTYTYEPTGTTQSASYAITATPITPSDAKYVKVTSTAGIVSGGKYLIVNEDAGAAFNGTTDANSNKVVYTASGSDIATSDALTACEVTITYDSVNSRYSLLNSNGKYVGRTTSSNGLEFKDDAIYNTISFSGNNVSIRGLNGSSGTYYLMYNKASGTERFRYYNNNQETVQLYKYQQGASKELKWITAELKTGTYYQGSTVNSSNFTVTAHYNGGSPQSEVVTENITVTNGYLANIGDNLVTLTYGGKSYNVNVVAVEQTATLTGLTWAQGELTIIDGHAIDFSTLGTVTATYDTIPSSNVALDTCTVSTYTKSNDTYIKVSDIDDGDTISSTSHGKYLGVSYTEKGVTKVAYSSDPIYVVEAIEDVFTQVATYTWTKVSSLSVGDTVILTGTKADGTEPHELSGVTANSGTIAEFTTNPTGAYKLTVVEGSSTGSFAFKDEDNNYLSHSGTDKTLSLSNTLNASSSWTVEFDSETPTKATVTNVDSEHPLQYNPGNYFRVYSSASQQPIQFYKGEAGYSPTGTSFANTNAIAQKVVLEFASYFNDTMNCVAGGSTSNVSGKWSDIAEEFYNWFEAGDKDLDSDQVEHAYALFANAYSVDGGDSLQDMLARYDYIVAKYELSDFLSSKTGRGAVAQSPRVSPLVNIIGENTNIVAIIVIISMVSVTAIGGYFFLRKRKEN